MGFFGSQGGSAAAGTTTASYNLANDTLSGVASNPDGTPAAGRSIRIFLDGASTPNYTVTTASDGTWSQANVGMADGLAHAFQAGNPSPPIGLAVGNYAPVFKRVRFDGSSYARIATGGMFVSGDQATGLVPVLSSGVVTSFQAGATGYRYEPGIPQSLTRVAGAGSGLVATVAARADGRLYGEDVTITNGGSSYTSAATFRTTRKVSKGIFGLRMQLASTIGASDYFFSSGLFSVRNQSATVTRIIQGGTPTGFDTINAANALTTSAMKTLLFSFDYTKSTAAEALRCYSDDTSVLAASPTFNSGTLLDIEASAAPTIAFMSTTAGASIAEGDVDFMFVAFGYDAILGDGSLPDLAQKANRDKFTLAGLGADGSGLVGRKPNFFLTGPASSWAVNKGASSPAMTLTGTLTDVT